MRITFDQVLGVIKGVFEEYQALLSRLGPMLVNRDVSGRVRLVLHQRISEDTEMLKSLQPLLRSLSERLEPHAFPPERMALFEPDLDAIVQRSPCFLLEGFDGVRVVDRLTAESHWSHISQPSEGAPRLVFYSLKGGVGRSTALAVAAWSLAQAGRRVMVLDLDLESPGISSMLLPGDRRPEYGITDWLVEDLVENGDAVLNGLVAWSELSRDGEILVVPAHGKDPGEYVFKLGRVWMPKVQSGGAVESWAARLSRLIQHLERQWRPDVLLMDARAGIDEVAAACVTELGARCTFLFATDSEQTWTGYRALFEHWRRTGAVHKIRERLQLVGALVPELGTSLYLEGLRERAWELFRASLYDEVSAFELEADPFTFDLADPGAPHLPRVIHWHRSLVSLQSLEFRDAALEPDRVRAVFGHFLDGLDAQLPSREVSRA